MTGPIKTQDEYDELDRRHFRRDQMRLLADARAVMGGRGKSTIVEAQRDRINNDPRRFITTLDKRKQDAGELHLCRLRQLREDGVCEVDAFVLDEGYSHGKHRSEHSRRFTLNVGTTFTEEMGIIFVWSGVGTEVRLDYVNDYEAFVDASAADIKKARISSDFFIRQVNRRAFPELLRILRQDGIYTGPDPAINPGSGGPPGIYSLVEAEARAVGEWSAMPDTKHPIVRLDYIPDLYPEVEQITRDHLASLLAKDPEANIHARSNATSFLVSLHKQQGELPDNIAFFIVYVAKHEDHHKLTYRLHFKDNTQKMWRPRQAARIDANRPEAYTSHPTFAYLLQTAVIQGKIPKLSSGYILGNLWIPGEDERANFFSRS